jgi:hypothetical protein
LASKRNDYYWYVHRGDLWDFLQPWGTTVTKHDSIGGIKREELWFSKPCHITSRWAETKYLTWGMISRQNFSRWDHTEYFALLWEVED